MKKYFIALAFLLLNCSPVRQNGANDQTIELDPKILSATRLSPRQINSILPYSENTLLAVTWIKINDYMNLNQNKKPALGELTLILDAAGTVSLLRRSAMREVSDWSRLYPEEEAEKLFDGIIPSIEQFSLQDLRPKRDHYIVAFTYQTNRGYFSYNCVLNDITPITALLVQLRMGGVPLDSRIETQTQQWARNRFGEYLKTPEPLIEMPDSIK